mmetsp:Transcript_3190/g.13349  ORF Transcript_3190/g.13349 Transcript_3190/m.13349 type:complete len:306 (+) Transcript_3190:1404-2321(+)
MPSRDVLHGGRREQRDQRRRLLAAAAVQGGLVLRVGNLGQHVRGRRGRLVPDAAVPAGELLPEGHVHPHPRAERQLRPRRGQHRADDVSPRAVHALRGVPDVSGVPRGLRVRGGRHVQAHGVSVRHHPLAARLHHVQKLPHGHVVPVPGRHGRVAVRPLQPRLGVFVGGRREQQALRRLRVAGGERVHHRLRARAGHMRDGGAAAPGASHPLPRGLRVRRAHNRRGGEVPRRVFLRLRHHPRDAVLQQVSDGLLLPGGHGGVRSVPVPVLGVPLLPGGHRHHPAALSGRHQVRPERGVHRRVHRR